jgi:hypothetical protein
MSEHEQSMSVAAIGQDLMQHAKTFEVDGNKRGLVVQLFPAIFMASERMSARGISRFLRENHGVKLSAVTITKALNDPKKYWNSFFDLIEPSVIVYEKLEPREKREDFLYDDNAFKRVEFPGREVVRKVLLKFEAARAIDELREKWFSIDRETRLKARPYLAQRLLGKVR